MKKIIIFIFFCSFLFANVLHTYIKSSKNYPKIEYIYNNLKNPLFNKTIKQNPNILNYLIISAYYSKNNQKALKLYKRLKQTIPNNEITSFGNMLDIFTNQYKYSFDFVYKTFIFLNRNLTKNQLSLLIQYPESLALFFYKSKILNIKNHQKILLILYKNLYKKYRFHKNYKKLILITFNSTAIYLINQSKKINPLYFKKVFTFLIRNNFFNSLINKNKCSSPQNFAIFAKNGIINLIKFYKFNDKIFYKFSQYSNNLPALMFIVNIYTKFHHKNWDRFKDLLTSLTNNIYYNTVMLSKLYKYNYFKMLKHTKNADTFIHIDSKDISSIAAKKYKYILFTSLGNQNSGKNILYEITHNKKNISHNLKFLLSLSPEELSKHLFTNKDKFVYYFNKLDLIVTTISIALVIAPLSTNGLSYVIAKELQHTGSATLQYAIKESIKKILTNSQNSYIFTNSNQKYQIQNKIKQQHNYKKINIHLSIGNFLINNNYKPKLLCN